MPLIITNYNKYEIGGVFNTPSIISLPINFADSADFSNGTILPVLIEGGTIAFKSADMPLPVAFKSMMVIQSSVAIDLPVTFFNAYDEFDSSIIPLPVKFAGMLSMESPTAINLPINFPNDTLEFNNANFPFNLPVTFDVDFPELGFGATTGNIKYINDNISVLGNGTTTGNISYTGVLVPDGQFTTANSIDFITNVQHKDFADKISDSYYPTTGGTTGGTAIVKKLGALSAGQSGGIQFTFIDINSDAFVYFADADDDGVFPGSNANKWGVRCNTNGTITAYKGTSSSAVYSINYSTKKGAVCHLVRNTDNEILLFIDNELKYTFSGTFNGNLSLFGCALSDTKKSIMADVYSIDQVITGAIADKFTVDLYANGGQAGPFTKYTGGEPTIVYSNLTNPEKITWQTLVNFAEDGTDSAGMPIKDGSNKDTGGAVAIQTLNPGEGLIWKYSKHTMYETAIGLDSSDTPNGNNNVDYSLWVRNEGTRFWVSHNGSNNAITNDIISQGDSAAIVYENATTIKYMYNENVIYTDTVPSSTGTLYIHANTSGSTFLPVIYKANASEILAAGSSVTVYGVGTQTTLTFDPANLTGITESSGTLTKTAADGFGTGLAVSNETIGLGEGVIFPHPGPTPNASKGYFGMDHAGAVGYANMDMAVRTDSTLANAPAMELLHDGTTDAFTVQWTIGEDIVSYRHKPNIWWIYHKGAIVKRDTQLTPFIQYDLSNKTKINQTYWDVMRDVIYSDIPLIRALQPATGQTHAWNKRAWSAITLPANTEGYVEYVSSTAYNSYTNIGFSQTFHSANTGPDIDVSMYYVSNYKPHEGSNSIASSVAGSNITGEWGDVVRIYRDASGNFSAYINGTLYHQYSVANVGEMHVEFQTYSASARLNHVVISINGAAPVPVTWEIMENVIETYVPALNNVV